MKTFHIEALIARILKWPWFLHQTCKMAKKAVAKCFKK